MGGRKEAGPAQAGSAQPRKGVGEADPAVSGTCHFRTHQRAGLWLWSPAWHLWHLRCGLGQTLPAPLSPPLLCLYRGKGRDPTCAKWGQYYSHCAGEENEAQRDGGTCCFPRPRALGQLEAQSVHGLGAVMVKAPPRQLSPLPAHEAKAASSKEKAERRWPL